MTFEQLAVRLAGGLAQPVDDNALREAISAVLPERALGELDAIKGLPGTVSAAANTLRKAWRAGVDLQARAGEHPRLQSIASLEAAVIDALPPAMMRPADLVAAGVVRLEHVQALFGPIEIVGITELSPVWRPLLHAISANVPVRWIAGPRPVPDWLDGSAIEIVRDEPRTPNISAVSAACQRRRDYAPARRSKDVPRASAVACPGSPREGPARGATRRWKLSNRQTIVGPFATAAARLLPAIMIACGVQPRPFCRYPSSRQASKRRGDPRRREWRKFHGSATRAPLPL